MYITLEAANSMHWNASTWEKNHFPTTFSHFFSIINFTLLLPLKSRLLPIRMILRCFTLFSILRSVEQKNEKHYTSTLKLIQAQRKLQIKLGISSLLLLINYIIDGNRLCEMINRLVEII